MNHPQRHATSAVETAVVLPICLLALFAILDLGLATLRLNSLTEATHYVGRIATIRGSDAPSPLNALGPQPMEITAAQSQDLFPQLAERLPTMSPESVIVALQWPDLDNRAGQRVRVELRFRHDALLLGLTPWGDLDLKTSTVMTVIN